MVLIILATNFLLVKGKEPVAFLFLYIYLA